MIFEQIIDMEKQKGKILLKFFVKQSPPLS